MAQKFMMNDVRFPFYDTESGRYVVYKGKVYRYQFIDYMTFRRKNELSPISPETMAKYLEQLEPCGRELGMVLKEAEVYEREQEEQRKCEEHRAALIRDYRADYENACDDLYYGYGFKFWYGHYGVSDRLSKEDAKILWRAAVLEMSKD